MNWPIPTFQREKFTKTLSRTLHDVTFLVNILRVNFQKWQLICETH